MPVSVNPIKNDADDRNIQILGAALGLARDVYKVNMDEKAAAKAQEFTLQKYEKEQQAKAAENKRNEDIKVAENFLEVPSGTKGAITLPDRTGLFLPRTDARAVEANALKKQENDNKLAEITETKKTNERAKLAGYEDKFRNDKAVNDNREKITAANMIDNLVDSESPILDAVALRQVFRLSGDVGAIRDPDLRDLGSSPELKERALQALGMLQNGQRIRPEARADIKKMAHVVQQLAQRDVNRLADRYADTAARELRGFNKSDILQILAPESALPTTERLVDSGDKNQGGGLGLSETAYAGTGEKPPQQKFLYQPGTIIEHGGIKMIVGPDGKTATPFKR